MHEPTQVEIGRLAQDLQLKRKQVENVIRLFDDGNTVPFITRYRKEATGDLDEEQIRDIQHRVRQLRQLAERRETILRSIEAQARLTPELKAEIENATTSKRLEDLYLPYKPKKQTLATLARQRGLEPLADAIWNRDEAVANLGEILPGMIDPEKQLHTVDDVLTGVQHILAERIAEHAGVCESARRVVWAGRLVTSRSNGPAAPAETPPKPTRTAPISHESEFRDYFQFSEPLRNLPPHRVLAINRGERLGILKVKIDFDRGQLEQAVLEPLPLADHPHRDFLQRCAADAVERLLVRAMEREVRSELTEVAGEHAISVFARNLRSLLLQPPVHGRRVLAIDPGYRTGCKYTVLDEIGNLLDHGIIYPHLTRKKKKKKVKEPAQEPVAGAEPVSAGPAVPAEEPVAAEPPHAAAPILPPGLDRMPPSVLPADSFYRSTSEGDEPTVLSASLALAGIVTPPPGLWEEFEALLEPKANKMPPKKKTKRPPLQPVSRRDRAKHLLTELCRMHNVAVIAIGNGTACRESEQLVAEIIAEGLCDVSFVIVNEAGASVYSTSAPGREEFPEYDAMLRGTISIGRRLQDPLSELVKIDPQHLGIGLYQHDINPRHLKESLAEVVESCVNYVGVDLNTASVPLLQYVSGLNQLRARNIVEHRKTRGPFRNRFELQEVSGVGPAVFTQAAGFLRITGGDQAFDNTWIHPESYPVAQAILERLGYTPSVLTDRERTEELRQKLAVLNPEELAPQVGAGVPTVQDILENLARPGRDPREDFPPPVFKKGILTLDDLTDGMELRGTVLNVVDFGVFIDIGLKDSGLVHISEMADRFIRSPYDVVSVGDVVTVWVIKVDKERRRVSLSMISPEARSHRQEQGRAGAPAGRPAHPERRERKSPPPRRQRPQPAQPEAQTPTPHQPRRPQRRPPQPRPARPARPKQPPVKLSQGALEGKEVLHTFGELKALFEAKRHKHRPKDDGEAAKSP